MRTQSFGLFAVAAASSSASFFLGTKFKDWMVDMNLINPYSEAQATGVLVAPLPSAPSFSLPERSLKAVEELDIWKKPSRAAEIMKFGYPGYDNLRTYEDFILSYDRRTRTAHWVIEHLTPDRMTYDPSVDRSKSEFRPDESIHPFFRSTNEDYRRSGYDRGHLAAAANHRRTQLSIDQTFMLTNMSPQVGKGFNRDKWNDLEKHTRGLARINPNVYICSGPLYLSHQETDGNFYVKYKVIGPNRVAVPTHFFKIVLIETSKDNFELEVYLMPNAAIPDEKPICDFFVPLDVVERVAGFLVFEHLPREKLKKINGKKVGGGRGLLFS